MIRLLALAACLAAPGAWGAVPDEVSSPTLEVLKGEAAKGAPRGAGEAAKDAAGQAFEGGASLPAAALPKGAPAVSGSDDGYDHYHFTGTSPMQGVSIYTPVKDADGSGTTKEPKPAPPVKPWVIGALVGGGLAATAGGAVALGYSAGAAGAAAVGLAALGGALLFLGGAAIAVGVVLWFLNKKATSK